MKPFSIVYQILEECIFKCSICNRRYIKNINRLSNSDRERMIANLITKGMKRLTITGGEPMMIKEEIMDFLKYLHQNKIHTCLSTTGYTMNKVDLIKLDQILDHLLISLPTLNLQDWYKFYRNDELSFELYKSVMSILDVAKQTNIILEISTVLHKNNINKIIDIGHELSSINSNIIWRIEYYYPMGINYKLKNEYYLTNEDIYQTHIKIKNEFKKVFKYIYLSKPTRNNAPDFYITPLGDLITTNDEKYSNPMGNALEKELNINFQMRRKWNEYKIYCRKWNN